MFDDAARVRRLMSATGFSFVPGLIRTDSSPIREDVWREHHFARNGQGDLRRMIDVAKRHNLIRQSGSTRNGAEVVRLLNDISALNDEAFSLFAVSAHEVRVTDLVDRISGEQPSNREQLEDFELLVLPNRSTSKLDELGARSARLGYGRVGGVAKFNPADLPVVDGLEGTWCVRDRALG